MIWCHARPTQPIHKRTAFPATPWSTISSCCSDPRSTFRQVIREEVGGAMWFCVEKDPKIWSFRSWKHWTNKSKSNSWAATGWRESVRLDDHSSILILNTGVPQGCVLYRNCAVSDQKALVKTVRYIDGVQLPSIKDIHHKRCLRRVRSIITDTSHRNPGLVTPLRCSLHCPGNSVFPSAVSLLNSELYTPTLTHAINK